MTPVRCLAAVLTAFAAFCGTASADWSPDGWTFPGQRPDLVPAELVFKDVAIAYWAAHGVTGCPQGVSLLQATSLDGDDQPPGVMGRGGDCQAWVIDTLTAKDTFEDQRVTSCEIVMHEVGHALGLPHLPSGVMAAYWGTPPRECRDAGYQSWNGQMQDRARHHHAALLRDGQVARRQVKRR